MNSQEHKEFSKYFIEKYLAYGFGSMPKSEIDLLVFHLLTQTNDYKNKSNYELASLFKIPESRIKTLRLNSALKYKEINSKAILGKIVDRLVHSEQFASFEAGKIEISLEDPIEKRELENFLKKQGHHAEYTLNSELLRIQPIRLFELILDNIDNANAEFNTLVQTHINEQDKVNELVNNALTLKQKFGKLRKQALNADTLRALLGGAVGLLGAA